MNTLFEVVTWPESQELMNQEGFKENSCLVNEEPFLTEFGSSAYFVRQSWLNSHLQDLQTHPLEDELQAFWDEVWEDIEADQEIDRTKSFN